MFACNAKNFAIAIIFFFFFFSTANLDGLTKVTCQIFFICSAGQVWLNLLTEEILHEKCLLKFKMFIWNVKHDMPCALEKIIMVEVSEHTSEHINSVLYMLHHLAGVLLKVANAFHSENLALFTKTSIQSIQKSTQKRNSETKYGKEQKNQSSSRSKDREIKLINKDV